MAVRRLRTLPSESPSPNVGEVNPRANTALRELLHYINVQEGDTTKKWFTGPGSYAVVFQTASFPPGPQASGEVLRLWGVRGNYSTTSLPLDYIRGGAQILQYGPELLVPGLRPGRRRHKRINGVRRRLRNEKNVQKERWPLPGTLLDVQGPW